MTERAALIETLRAIVEAWEPWKQTVLTIDGSNANIDIALLHFDGEAKRAVDYFMAGGRIDVARNMFRRAMVETWPEAARAAWIEAGGDLEDLPDEAVGTPAELDEFALSFFDDLRDIRDKKRTELGAEAALVAASLLAISRLRVWQNSLRGWYNRWKLKGAGKKRVMLTWNLGRTEQHCSTCARLDGNRHAAQWYANRRYYPRTPGANLECGGWRCDCWLTDDEGHDYTLA